MWPEEQARCLHTCDKAPQLDIQQNGGEVAWQGCAGTGRLLQWRQAHGDGLYAPQPSPWHLTTALLFLPCRARTTKTGMDTRPDCACPAGASPTPWLLPGHAAASRIPHLSLDCPRSQGPVTAPASENAAPAEWLCPGPVQGRWRGVCGQSGRPAPAQQPCACGSPVNRRVPTGCRECFLAGLLRHAWRARGC